MLPCPQASLEVTTLGRITNRVVMGAVGRFAADRKQAPHVVNKVTQITLVGRSSSPRVRIDLSCQVSNTVGEGVRLVIMWSRWPAQVMSGGRVCQACGIGAHFYNVGSSRLRGMRVGRRRPKLNRIFARYCILRSSLVGPEVSGWIQQPRMRVRIRPIDVHSISDV